MNSKRKGSGVWVVHGAPRHTAQAPALAAGAAPDPAQDHADVEAEGQPHSRARPQAPRAESCPCEGPLPAKTGSLPYDCLLTVTACRPLRTGHSDLSAGVALSCVTCGDQAKREASGSLPGSLTTGHKRKNQPWDAAALLSLCKSATSKNKGPSFKNTLLAN